jgi:hypothetical protein
LSFEERLNILHLFHSHQLNPSKIGKVLGMKYSTVRAVVLAYQKTGRLNKLLTYSAKEKLLKMRKSKDKKVGFQPWKTYKRKNQQKALQINLKLNERVPGSEIKDQISMKIVR